jgi:SAM-dependent methyltransferase
MRALNIRVPAARRILDFGCGVGWVLAEAQTEGEPLRFGLDNSLDALQGRCGGPQLRADRPLPKLELVVGDGSHLPFVEEAFDVVVGHVSLPYINTRAGLQEIYRVLAPGGSVLLTLHSFWFVRERLRKSLRDMTVTGVMVALVIMINGLLNHFSLPQMRFWWNPRQFETVNTRRGVRKAAEKAGFILISMEHVAGRAFFTVTARKPNPQTGAVLPAPGWAVNTELAERL